MDRINPEHVVAALEAAPAYARLGLSVRDERLRDRALRDLAEFVAERLNGPGTHVSRDQLRLPL